MIYLMIGGLPEDKFESKQLHRRAGQYTPIHDELLWPSANDTLMKCITTEEGCAILQDIHVGICGTHTGARSLVRKTYKQGFFWPTAMSNVDFLVRRCERC
jgi:hypothetical protein